MVISCVLRFLAIAVFGVVANSLMSASPLIYEGDTGAGKGKHLVFLAGDHEYRTEESLPALARILAKRFGFKCTVLFSLDPETGYLKPGNSYLPGTGVLEEADVMVLGIRFLDLPREQLQPIVDYIERAGPVVGFRTSTHGFKIGSKDSKYYKYHYQYKGDDYWGGFGRQVLGETWAGHYGKNHVQSTRLSIVEGAKWHPIMRGVGEMWVQAGGYTTDPMSDSEILAMAQPLNGMTADSPPDPEKKPMAGIWVREYEGTRGQKGRVFTTTYGASEDILDPQFRRASLNGILWACGLEDAIQADANIDFVGPYHPATFRFEGYRQEMKPEELSGWEVPIMPLSKRIDPPKPRKKK